MGRCAWRTAAVACSAPIWPVEAAITAMLPFLPLELPHCAGEKTEEYTIRSKNMRITTILSSKDLCMIDHLDELIEAGVSSLKIEGRMKSSYYVAVVTRAYRKALDKDPQWKDYREDLINVSHREYSTGFFFGSGPIDPTKGSMITKKDYQQRTLFCGFIREQKRTTSTAWS